MDQNSVLKQAEKVTYEIVADEAILIDMNSGAYFSLNEVGTMFWGALDGTRTVGEIAAEIAETFNDKATKFVGELSELADTAVDDDEEIVAKQLESLAAAYDMDVELVAEYLVTLQSGDRVERANELIGELGVDEELVLADLLELAEEMAAENLLVEVG